jgi:hypothetical protein
VIVAVVVGEEETAGLVKTTAGLVKTTTDSVKITTDSVKTSQEMDLKKMVDGVEEGEKKEEMAEEEEDGKTMGIEITGKVRKETIGEEIGIVRTMEAGTRTTGTIMGTTNEATQGRMTGEPANPTRTSTTLGIETMTMTKKAVN